MSAAVGCGRMRIFSQGRMREAPRIATPRAGASGCCIPITNSGIFTPRQTHSAGHWRNKRRRSEGRASLCNLRGYRRSTIRSGAPLSSFSSSAAANASSNRRLKCRYDAAWDKFIAAFTRHWDTCRKAGFDPDKPRDERGRWTDSGGSDRPNVPKERPPTARLRNRVIKEVAKWLAKAAAREVAGPVGTLLNIVEAGSWLYEAYPYIRSYLDEPKTLDELHQAVRTRDVGYDIHHIVEQTPAEQDGYPRSLIDGPENLVRVPTLKHWEITGWYMTGNEDYGGLSPRAYLRGKNWEERRRVGLRALIRHGVLTP